MATTLLSAVNSVLRRARVINLPEETLSSLTINSLQVDIDMCVDAINDVLREMYCMLDLAPYETKQGTITLVEGQREYDFETDFEVMASEVFMNQSDGDFLLAYPGGYEAMFTQQNQPDNYTGNPSAWTTNPITNKIRLDREPTAEHVGDVYTYLYTTEVRLSVAADVFPFSDAVTRALIPAFAESYREDAALEDFNIARKMEAMSFAVALLNHRPNQNRY